MIVALTLLALSAFALNSILTRAALGAGRIDAATFTSIRLLAGAVVLACIVRARAGAWASLRGRGVLGPVTLFIYAAPFSFAYLRIGAAVGALVLFGVVQLTMIAYGMARGERPSAAMWLGLVLATAGLVILTAPSARRPDLLGVALMSLAGVAWAIYTLHGRTTRDPLAATARSFLWSCPLALLLSVIMHREMATSARGVTLAAVSGAVTSGLGYAIWYRALPRLSITQAAVAQLSVPVLAAACAAAFLHEMLDACFTLAATAVLGGIGLVLSARRPRPMR